MNVKNESNGTRNQNYCRRSLTFALAMFITSSLAVSMASAQTPQLRASGSVPLQQAQSLSQAFKAAANSALPSVVKIKTTTNRDGQVLVRGFFPVPAPDQEGLGSGVIIEPLFKYNDGQTGIILTNNHVVKDADTVIVELQDGTELYATEYLTDPLADLAIIKVRTSVPLPTAKLGDSDALSIGDWVLAVGHPLELETSVSAGIISAKGRLLGKVPRAQFLQTDAAINPGNSGGPLVNLRGEVVGINTAIASQTGGYQGIGFAVPANLVKDIVRQLLEKGSVTRGYLGVTIQELTKDLSEQLATKNAARNGVVVNHVKGGTPAERSGVRPGDVITSFANYPVDSPSSLQRAVERVPVGSKQRLEIIRYGKPMTVAVNSIPFESENFEERFRSVRKVLKTPVSDNSNLGFEVANLSELARRQGIRVDGNAVVITRVGRRSLAANEELTPGMIVKQVRNTPISTVDEFYDSLQNESLADGILMLIEDTDRETGGDRFVVLQAIQ